jgi:hypothetical protein
MSPPPPPKAKKNTKAWVPPPPPPKAKTQEALNERVRKEVRDQFVPRKFEPKQPVNPAGQKFFITMCQPRKKETLSNYDRSITKSYQKKSNRRAKNIPKLGEHPQKLIPPLHVLQKRMKL